MIDFPCGCQIPKTGIDYNNLPDCPAVWDTICEGKTKGIFQLESGLGKSWAMRAMPRSIEELSDLISIIRPSVLEAKIDDKSLTQHYIDRKHGKEQVTYIHPSLEPILKNTYGILIFQEQALLIAKEIAGYSLNEADSLRKSIGKKNPEEMAKHKVKFIEGCIKKGIVDEKTAKEIFDWVEKGQRYGFNKSIEPNTIVQTKDGLKTIDDIIIGERIKTPEGYSTVKNKYEHGILELYEIELESGKKIQCTLDHKFLCNDGKIRPLKYILIENHEIVVDMEYNHL